MTSEKLSIKLCEETYKMAIQTLDFIRGKYEADIDDAGTHKYIEALQMGMKAFEKQMPKKIHISPYIYTRCNCGYEFSNHYGDGYYGVPEEKRTHFCPNCGQALDWSDTE